MLSLRNWFDDDNDFITPFDFTFSNKAMRKFNSFGKTDIKETDKDFVVTVDLPGCNKQDINLTFDKRNNITIKANHDEKKEKNDKAKFIMRERSSSSFERTFTLP